MVSKNVSKKIESEDILEGEPISPYTEKWAAVGRKLLEESIEVGRDYSKFMIQFSIGAVPVYIVLLKFLKDGMASKTTIALPYSLIFLLLPTMLFLISSMIFIIAYYPKSAGILVNTVEDIRNIHQRLLNRRHKMNLIGTIFFMLATISSVVILLATF